MLYLFLSIEIIICLIGIWEGWCFDISSEYFEYIDVHQAFLCNQVPEKMMLKCKNYFS